MKNLIQKYFFSGSSSADSPEKKNTRLKFLIPAITAVSVLVGVIFFVFNETYESKYITVKLSGDAEKFEGFINFLNDKNGVEGVTLENDLPQEHRLKTNKLYVHLKLISGDYIIVEYRTKGELIDKDTVYSGLYKRRVEVKKKDEHRGTIAPAEPPMDRPPAGLPSEGK